MKEFLLLLLAVGVVSLTSCGSEDEPQVEDEEVEDIMDQLGLEEENEFANSGMITLDNYQANVPMEWEGMKPGNPMRVYEYSLGEGTESVIYVTKLPKKGSPMGDFSDPKVILDKWKGEFQNPQNPMEQNLDNGSMVYGVEGTYVKTDMGTGSTTSFENYMMMAGYMPTEENVFTFKMVGPKEEVESQRDRFLEMMNSIMIMDAAEEDAVM